MMYKVINNLAPSYLLNSFTKTSQIHAHYLRNSGLYVQQPNTDARKKSFSYRGAALWNKFSNNIRRITSIDKSY